MPSPVSRTGWYSLEPRFCHEFLSGFAYHTCRARRASVYLGHSIAVRICRSQLCLVFISPIAVLCILEFTALSLRYPGQVRSCPSTGTATCVVVRYCHHRSDGVPHHRRKVRYLTHRSCGRQADLDCVVLGTRGQAAQALRLRRVR